MCAGCTRTEERLRLQGGARDLFRFLQEKMKELKVGAIKQFERKKTENLVKRVLEREVEDVEFVHDKGVMQADAACPGSRLRPDFQLVYERDTETWRARLADIWIEVDERQHSAYVCELARLNEMLWARGTQRPCVVIRVNMDAFSTPWKRSSEPMPKKARFEIILKVIQEQIALAKSDLQSFILKIIWICFDCPSSCDGSCACVHVQTYTNLLEIERDIQEAE